MQKFDPFRKYIYTKGEIRMKVVRQRDEKDCGVCCLASIIKHYKGNVPLEKIRLDAKTTVEGTTALNLILASTKYGFEATGVKLNSVKDIKQFPAIAPAIANHQFTPMTHIKI